MTYQMTYQEKQDVFIETLRSHRGGLVRLLSDLFWYSTACFDQRQDRICLILDANDRSNVTPSAESVNYCTNGGDECAGLHVLIDGKPAWIWITKVDVVLIDCTISRVDMGPPVPLDLLQD